MGLQIQCGINKLSLRDFAFVRAKILQLSIMALTMVLYFCSQNFMVIFAVGEIEMHGNRVLDLIFVMFWSHALTHPCVVVQG